MINDESATPLSGEQAASVLGGLAAVAQPRWTIAGYTWIDGVAYPNYIEDTAATAPEAPAQG